jgi:putative transcriptional regulator
MSRAKTLLGVLFVLTASVALPGAAVFAADTDAVLLVAARRLHDPVYRETVVVARPLAGGAHLGFILNRPTRYALGDLFPADGPSKKVRDHVNLGGPESVNVVVALVAGHLEPGSGLMQIAPYLYLALSAKTVDDVIASAADRARYFVGVVLWRPGELDRELKQHAWHVAEFEPEIALRKDTAGLWAELVKRAEGRDKAIVVQNETY